MKPNHHLISPVFLSVILLTGTMVGFPTQDVFAANEKQNVGDNDKKPLKQITQSNIESLKGLNANEKRVIVFYKNDVKSEDLTELTEKGANIKSDFDKMRAVVVHIDAAKLKDLQLDPNIERIVEDQIVHATLDTSIPQIGANSVYSSGITGQGIKTCIVDTGVDDTHPALNPLIAEINYVPFTPTGDATDDHGHGTHVAGIIASNDATFRGVAPDSSLMAAKVLDSNGDGFTSDVASGIDWCVANGADVINLSLGGDVSTGTCDSNLDAMAVNDAVAAGVIVAVASGNNGFINAVSTPACASGAIAVGAVDDFDGRTSFSNEGPQLDVVAPGAPVTSLNAPINGGGFITFQGTSMATPHVAGLAALILDANPSLTPTQVRSAIENNALDLGDAGFDTIYGNGRIQVSNSVNSVLPLSDSISSATGTGTISLSTVSGGISSLNSISESTLPTSGKPATSFPHGFTSWTVAGLTSGQTITVTLTYPSAIPAGSQYWKVIGGSWVDATSILGSNDGDNILTLTIQDNGPFDVNPASGIISDPGGPGVVPIPTISIDDMNMALEGITPSTFTVSLSSISASDITVDYTVSDVTATGGSDYNLPSGTITIVAGSTSAGITFDVIDDVIDEPAETFNVILSNPVGATILDGTGVATISDNDDPISIPTISIDDMNMALEGITPSTFTVSLSSISASDITVDYTVSDVTATGGSDYNLPSGTITIVAGSTSAGITFDVIDDVIDEPAETFNVILSNPVGATILDGTGVATISDNDDPISIPTISIDDMNMALEGITPSTFTVSLSSISASDITVDYTVSDVTATGGSDYNLPSGTITIVAGSTSAGITFDVIDDVIDEPAETFNVILSNPVGATILDGTGVATISDNDPPTISISNVTITEGDTSITSAPFTVFLSSPSTSTVTVDFFTFDGTATGDIDYTTASGTLTFSPGNTTQTVNIEVLGDTTVEANETFNVALTNPVNTSILDDTGVGTILDDDGIIIPPRAFLSINSGGSGTILSVFGSGFTSGSDVTVQFDGTTLSITPATNGKFTTQITIPTSISGTHTISASDGVNTFTNQFIVIAPRVTPTGTILFLNPINSASPDSVVLLHGKGFAGNADATITISVDGVPITTTAVGKVGSFKNISITMPSTLGTHTISASDGINTAFSTFYIIQ